MIPNLDHTKYPERNPASHLGPRDLFLETLVVSIRILDVCDRLCRVLISLGKQAALASGARCLDVVSLLLFLSFLLPPSSLLLVAVAPAVCGFLLWLLLLLLLVLGGCCCCYCCCCRCCCCFPPAGGRPRGPGQKPLSTDSSVREGWDFEICGRPVTWDGWKEGISLPAGVARYLSP